LLSGIRGNDEIDASHYGISIAALRPPYTGTDVVQMTQLAHFSASDTSLAFP
jgi:hypothetical protein